MNEIYFWIIGVLTTISGSLIGVMFHFLNQKFNDLSESVLKIENRMEDLKEYTRNLSASQADIRAELRVENSYLKERMEWVVKNLVKLDHVESDLVKIRIEIAEQSRKMESYGKVIVKDK